MSWNWREDVLLGIPDLSWRDLAIGLVLAVTFYLLYVLS